MILEYNLRGENGIEILEKLVSIGSVIPQVIIQTVLDDDNAGIRAVESGAKDYLVKGRFDSQELARAIRYVMERHRLVYDLRDVLARVKTLEGIIPICTLCKKIRNDSGFWSPADHTHANFSHGGVLQKTDARLWA